MFANVQHVHVFFFLPTSKSIVSKNFKTKIYQDATNKFARETKGSRVYYTRVAASKIFYSDLTFLSPRKTFPTLRAKFKPPARFKLQGTSANFSLLTRIQALFIQSNPARAPIKIIVYTAPIRSASIFPVKSLPHSLFTRRRDSRTTNHQQLFTCMQRRCFIYTSNTKITKVRR